MNQRAIISGFIGATTSFIAKLALVEKNDDEQSIYYRATQEQMLYYFPNNINEIDLFMYWVMKGIMLLVTILMNAIMMHFFLRGMKDSGSFVATALSNGSNFGLSVRY